MPYWQDKVCVVTGGSAGLGLAIGRALAEQGAQVVLVARRPEPLEAAVAELKRAGGKAVGVTGDMAWQEDVDRVAHDVTEQFGRVDMLCNCAGRSTRGLALETSPEDFQQLLEANFFTAVRATRAFAPQLLASRGHLVNIGSLASKVAPRYTGAYPASKYALAAYTQQLRLELAERRLHVMLVCPGPVKRNDAGVRYNGAPGIPESAHAPGAGAKIKSVDPVQLAAAVLRGCERRSPEVVMPAKARLLFAINQFSAGWGDWLLRRTTGG